jgi:SAM-dependent methyltransferase
MPRIHAHNQVELTKEEYDDLYRGNALDGLGLSFAPWDLGEPQRIIKEWESEGRITSPVLDAGCGSGHTAVYLAQCGYEVTGFDSSETAIQMATALAQAHGLASNPTFRIGDATALDVGTGYATVIDSMLYHCLAPAERHACLTGLRRSVAPRGRLLMICRADEDPADLPGPFRFSKADLTQALPAAGWTLTDVKAGHAGTLYRPDEVTEIAARAGGDLDIAQVPTDEKGRVIFSAWFVTAHAETEPGAGP